MNKSIWRVRRFLPALWLLSLLLFSVTAVAALQAFTFGENVSRPGIYWTQMTSSYVHRANLDGSDRQQVLSVFGQPSHVTVNPGASEIIFWALEPAEEWISVLWRAGLDGSDVRLAFLNQRDINAYEDSPTALGLDVQNQDLYWASQQPYYYYDELPDVDPGSIVRGNLDNGAMGIRFMPGPKDPSFAYPEEQPDLNLDPSSGKFYWSDEDGIRRATLDGIEAENVILILYYTALNPVEHAPFAVDDAGGKIYYAGLQYEADRQQIVGADLDAPWVNEVLLMEGAGVQIVDMAVDALHQKLYWTVRGRESGVRRANLDGTAVETINDAALGPHGLALDTAAGKIYWADWLARRIWRANLDGSDAEELVDTAPMRPRFLALNLAKKMIYWTGRGDGRVWQGAMDGGDLSVLVGGQPGNTGGIAYDALSDTILWVDTAHQAVSKARSDGTNIDDILYPRTGHISALFVEEQSGKIVWYDKGIQAIRRANLDGSGTEVVLSGEFGEATSLVWDPLRRQFCWADPLQRRIECSDWQGKNRRVLLDADDGLRRPNFLALDSRAGQIYWTDWSTESLHRADLDGSDMVTIIAGGLDGPSGLALNLEPLEISRHYLPLVSGPSND